MRHLRIFGKDKGSSTGIPGMGMFTLHGARSIVFTAGHGDSATPVAVTVGYSSDDPRDHENIFVDQLLFNQASTVICFIV